MFIDNDEWVEPLWLDPLYSYCQEQGWDVVVSGNLISDLPDKSPEHIPRIFNRKQQSTGTRLDRCATSNVLIPIHVTKILGLKFDEMLPSRSKREPNL